ncbi:MarR family transcriptional regulator [Vibrio jasicida]|uniref:MarR family transcriptional regulator n=1 Tax=Vibrio jasicida TaxID=766224 RepID=UPI000CE49ECF|nr:helix-turn-helix domain-containing protein [Vibrio jasicida]
MIFDIWGKLNDLERSEKTVLGWLASNASSGTWKVTFTQKQVMDELGYTQATVSRGVTKLRVRGYIQGKSRISTVYVDFDKLEALRE